MDTKLTLRLDDELIERAKKEARKRGSSLSKMVAGYFRGITTSPKKSDLPPVTARLLGVLRGADAANYRRHLEEKHL
jgi:hypothetical protein